MKQSFLLIISFYFLLLQSKPINAENLILNLNTTQELPQTGSSFFYTLNLASQIKEIDKYLIITTTPLSHLNPAFIYLSFLNESPSNTNSIINSQILGENSLYIPITESLSNTIYLGIYCESTCNGNITANLNEKIMLMNHKPLTLNPVNEIMDIYYEHINKEGFLSLNVYGENADLFYMVVSYSGRTVNTLEGKKLLENGYSLFINLAEYEMADEQNNYFIISLNTYLPVEDQYRINRKITLSINELNTQPIPFKILDNVYGYTETQSLSEICYKLEEQNDLIENDDNYILYINSNTQSVKVRITPFNDNETVIERKSYFNNYIILNNNLFSLKESTFCFSQTTPVNILSLNTNSFLFSFQLLPIAYIKQSKYQMHIPPLINGKNYIQYLPNNSLMLYRHSSYSNSLSLTTHLKTISGLPTLYGYKCTNFPYCSFKYETFHESTENFISNTDIALEYTIQSSDVIDENYLDNHIQFFSIVVCSNDDTSPCSYIIETNYLLERIELLPFETFSQGIDERYPKHFMIRLNDLNIFETLIIELTSITGNVEIEMDEFLELSQKKIEQYYTSSNHKQIYTLNKNDIELLNEKELNFTISSNSMGYFSLKYFLTNTQSKIHFEPNIVHIERITKDDIDKQFGFRHKSKTNKFQIIIKSFGCDINISFNETSYSQITNYHHIIYPENARDTYYYTISTTFNECSCYLIGNELNNDNELELVLTEGSIHSFKMNNDIAHLAFSYPLMYMNEYEGVILQIDMKKYTKLDVSIGVNQETRPFTKYTIYKSNTFIIKELMNNKCTFGTLCAVIILIDKEINDNNEEIEFNVILKNNQKVPIYLEQSQIRNDKIYPGDMQYFYSDLYYNKGEVVVHFMKGNGNAYGKIIKKNIFENNSNWLNRVILPSGNKEIDYNKKGIQIVEYDTLTERIVFDLNEDEWKCGKEDQCEIYIGITNEDMFIREDANPLGEYIIYMNNKDNNEDNIKGIGIELGEQIFGILEMVTEKEYQCNYYQMNVIENIARVLISFKHNCTEEDECSLYINNGYNNYPSPLQEYKYKYEIDNNVFSFTNEDNSYLSISVCQTKIGLHNNYYQFSLIPQYTEESNIILNNINIGESGECTFTYSSDNSGCHFILDKPLYEKISSFSLNVYEKGQNTKFELCHKEVLTSSIDSIIYNNRNELGKMILPERNSDCIKEINEFYFEGDESNIENKMHIMSFYINESKEIGSIVTLTLQISFYAAMEVLTLKPTQKEYLLHFNEVDEVHLNIINNSFSSFYIKPDNNEHTTVEYNSYSISTKQNTIINIFNKTAYKDLVIKNEHKSSFNFELFHENEKANIFYVEMNKNIFYLEHNIFPQRFYIKLEQNIPIYLNTKFLTKTNSLLLNTKFNISGYLTNDLDTFTLNDIPIKARMFSNKVGLINVNSQEMKYLCFTIDKINNVVYDNMLTNIFLNQYAKAEQSRIMLLYDEYYYAIFTENVFYEIPISDEGICIIEIAEGAYNLTLQNKKVLPHYLNYTIHSINTNDNYYITQLGSKIGVRTIQVNSTSKNPFMLEISKNPNITYNLTELEYIIKYYYTPKTFSYENTIKYTYNDEKLNLTFTPIATSSTHEQYLNTIFKLQLLTSSQFSLDQTYIETICPNIETNELNNTFLTYFNFDELTYSNNTFSILIDFSSKIHSLQSKMYLMLSSEYQDEKFIYKLLELSFTLPEDNPDEAPYSNVFVAILIVFIILTLLFGIFFYNRHLKFVKINSDLEVDAKIDKSGPIISIN